MARPSQADEKRKKFIPIVTRAFAELGYRRATTAELARRCKVRENVLYRLWDDKKSMFVAAIEYVYDQAATTWRELLAAESGHRKRSDGGPAVRLLNYEAEHYGESGLQRIIFAGLSETDEPEIRRALRRMYGRFHRFVRGQIEAHRKGLNVDNLPDATVAAWGIIGLGNLANVGRELGLLSDRGRRKMFKDAGRFLLDGAIR